MKPYEGKEKYIFVSCAHGDAGQVLPLLEALASRGCRLWYDDGTAPKDELLHVIDEHLRNCALMLVFLSPDYLKSRLCVLEMRSSIAQNRPCIAVDLSDTPKPAGLSGYLAGQNCLQKYKYSSDEQFLRALCALPGMDACGCRSLKTKGTHTKKPAGKPMLPLILAGLAVIAAISLFLTTRSNAPKSTGTEEAPSTETAVITEIPEVTAEPTPSPDPIAVAQIGDTVFFGTYEQDNDISDGKEPIEWLVLDKTEDTVLLISCKGLVCKPFNETFTDVSWETCTLRGWLNEEFVYKAFNEEEQARIAVSTVTADLNPDVYCYTGSDTKDRVFVLSIAEAKTYFKDNESRQCLPTEYAIANGAFVCSDSNGAGYTWWWLRTPGDGNSLATGVHASGAIRSDGNSVSNADSTVRPAIRVRY